jgi:hypothetical protein
MVLSMAWKFLPITEFPSFVGPNMIQNEQLQY